MKLRKAIGRTVTLATACLITITATGVTAFASQPGGDTISYNVVTTSGSSESGLGIILPAESRAELLQLAADSLTDAERQAGGTATVTVTATQLDIAQDMPSEVTAAEPVLSARFTISLAAGNSTRPLVVESPLRVTVQLPATLHGSSLYVTGAGDGGYSSTTDLDTVPNTVTMVLPSGGDFVLTKGKVTPPKQQEQAPPVTPEPASPTPVPNPAAGGIPHSLIPRSVLAQAVPISIPMTAMPTQSAFSQSMAATSMMMTAAFVSGSIDYENSPEGQEQSKESDNEDDDTAATATFDEDTGNGIENELNGFRRTRF